VLELEAISRSQRHPSVVGAPYPTLNSMGTTILVKEHGSGRNDYPRWYGGWLLQGAVAR
jgi:hypothetical protein